MKYILSCITILLISTNVAFGQTKSPQELADTYKFFHDKKDLDQIVTLFYSEDAASLAVSSIKRLMTFEFENGEKIDTVVVNQIDQSELEKMTNGFPYKGKLLVPTIKHLTHTMKVLFISEDPNTTESSAEIHIGKTDLGYFFTMTKLIEPN
jgi:hypothetical protein